MSLEIKTRPDYTKCLIHFTKPRIGKSRHFEIAPGADLLNSNAELVPASVVLQQILQDGCINGSTTASGCIKGDTAAVCFSEIPLSAAKYLCEGSETRYSYFGILVTKEDAFKHGARPVLYIPDAEADWVPPEQKWRQVRFEPGVVDWTFEREWRLPGDLQLGEVKGFYVMVASSDDVRKLEPVAKDQPKFRGFLVMNHLTLMM